VFLAQTYTRNSEFRAWIEDHHAVLQRLGKYDIAGPQVLLYRSSKSLLYTAKAPYPEIGISSRIIQNAWNWDIGRGTLQALGHSYLYLDDGALADGKMYGYPIIVDCGNETMPLASIEHLRKWIEEGGTYVVLPFTGRNSSLHPDSWLIEQLSGCKVSKIRKLGEGKLIFSETPSVFKAYAGESMDDTRPHVGINRNLGSTELEVGEEAEVLARFENGKPAIVRSQLGKGSVLVLGTVFWRQSEGRDGLFWPNPKEERFIGALLEDLNFEQPVGISDDRLVWSQPYRSNNGLETVLTLVSWHHDEDKEVNVKMRLHRKPDTLVGYGVDNENNIEFDWKDGVASFSIHMPAREVKVIAARDKTPLDALRHWWHYQNKLWQPLAHRPKIDFSKYNQGRWKDPTLDLRLDWRFTQEISGGNEWMDKDFDASKWKSASMGALHLSGALPGRAVRARKSFAVPSEWMESEGEIYLISASWFGPQYLEPGRLTLNGELVHDYSGENYHQLDVRKILRSENNVLGLEFRAFKEFLGMAGQIYLYHHLAPAESVALDGTWHAFGEQKERIDLVLPGKGRCDRPSRKIFVPLEWKDKYRVRLYLEGNKNSVLGAWVNQRMVRRHHHAFGEICDVDITRFLKYGQENDLTLAYGQQWRGGDNRKAGYWDLRVVRLDLHPVHSE
jgi:hypothetical protein